MNYVSWANFFLKKMGGSGGLFLLKKLEKCNEMVVFAIRSSPVLDKV